MIQAVNTLSPKVLFRGHENGNLSDIKTEKRIALINSAGIAGVVGAGTTMLIRPKTHTWRNASLYGVCAGLLTMLIVGPKLLYKANQKALQNSDKTAQDLFEDVNHTLKNRKSDLYGKIDNYAKSATLRRH